MSATSPPSSGFPLKRRVLFYTTYHLSPHSRFMFCGLSQMLLAWLEPWVIFGCLTSLHPLFPSSPTIHLDSPTLTLRRRPSTWAPWMFSHYSLHFLHHGQEHHTWWWQVSSCVFSGRGRSWPISLLIRGHVVETAPVALFRGKSISSLRVKIYRRVFGNGIDSIVFRALTLFPSIWIQSFLKLYFVSPKVCVFKT